MRDFRQRSPKGCAWPATFVEGGRYLLSGSGSAEPHRVARPDQYESRPSMDDGPRCSLMILLTPEVYPMPLTRAQVALMAEKARRMPPAPLAEANVTKQEAVRLLAPECRRRRSRASSARATSWSRSSRASEATAS